MKTLTGLDQKPALIEDIADDAVREKVMDGVFSFRRFLKIIAGNSKPKPGTEESIDLNQIGMKLSVVGDVSLEDAEFKLLREKAKDNTVELTSNVLGQILLKFREAEKASEK